MNCENIKIRESLEVGDVCLFSAFIDGKGCVLVGIEINAAVGNGDVTEGVFCSVLGRVGEAFKNFHGSFSSFCIGRTIRFTQPCEGSQQTDVAYLTLLRARAHDPLSATVMVSNVKSDTALFSCSFCCLFTDTSSYTHKH